MPYFPDSLTSIGCSAFLHCTGASIPAGCPVGSRAFEDTAAASLERR